MPEMSRKSKAAIIGAVSVLLIAFILYVAKVYPPPETETVSGTIGKVDKYRSEQMAEQDVKLRNILLDDSASVKESIIQLKNYKLFAEGLQKDMNVWMKQLGAVEEKIKNAQDPEISAVKERQKQIEEYITYIRANGGILDRTIGLLEKIAVRDSAALATDIGATLTDFENFRVRMSEKFANMIVTIPDINKLLIKNGQFGIINNSNAGLNIVVLSKEQMVAGMPDIQYSIFVTAKELGVAYMNHEVAGGIRELEGKIATGVTEGGFGTKGANQLIQIGTIACSKAGNEFIGNNNPLLNYVMNKNVQLNCYGNKELQLGITLPK